MAEIGSRTYYDSLGNPPQLAVLSFVPPTTVGLQWVEVFKRTGLPADDTFVERERVVDRIPGIYPYWYMLQTAEAGATYVVGYRDSSNAPTAASERISAELYYPPTPVTQEISVNAMVYTRELVRRQYLVLETMGERAILLRKKTGGLRCSCTYDEHRAANARCRECYGTGWVGGYNVFFPFLFDFNLAGERIQLTETAIALDQNPRAWTTIVPELRGGDVVVRQHSQRLDRFEVTNPTRSVRDGVGAVPTIQEFTVKVHTDGHPIYGFPVEKYVASYTRASSHSGLPEGGV
jgi:hypothetical protein